MLTRSAVSIVIAAAMCFSLPRAAVGAATQSTHDGDTRLAFSNGSVQLKFDPQALKDCGVTAPAPDLVMQINATASSFQLSQRDGRSEGLYGSLVTSGGAAWTIRSGDRIEKSQVGDFVIGFGGRYGTISDARDLHVELLELVPETVVLAFDAASSQLTISGDMTIAGQFMLGVIGAPRLSAVTVGRITIQGTTVTSEKRIDPAVRADLLLHSCDVSTGELRGDIDNPTSQPRSWGVAGAYAGYSIGTTSCNIGLEPLTWYSTGSATPWDHPVIGQTLYRYSVVNGAGRIEMLGQAWLKHGFCALQGSVCSSCTPYCGGCCDHLGVGCSDPYNASRNGGTSGMGPKSQVNPSTGAVLVWPYPTAPSDDVTTGRIRVRTADINPAANSGALYYAEGQYLSAPEIDKTNNCSYRRVVFGPSPSFTMSWFSTAAGQTVRQNPGLMAWAVNDPAVAYSHADIDGDGRFNLGYRVTDLSGVGSGPWHYEYAVHNISSDRSASSFTVPLGQGTTTRNRGFRDVEYYKDGFTVGTAYDGTDWPVTETPDSSIAWNMVNASPVENSNALRWGTMYNFRFDSNRPPIAGSVTLGLFKPGSPSQVSLAALVPSAIPCTCPGDLNASNTVDGDDIAPFTSMYLAQTPLSNCADIAAPNGGPLDAADVDGFVNLLVNGSNTCK